jgi:phosphoglycerate dehydrogenase-like enzyme
MVVGTLLPPSTAWADALGLLAREHPGHRVLIDRESTYKYLSELDAVVASNLSEENLRRAGALKALFVPFVGVDHLPVQALRERGVSVYNAHGNAESVAQCAVAMTLAFYGRTVEYHNDLRHLLWHGFWVGGGDEDLWSSIWGRSCAVFGTGAIGCCIARILKAFDCTVVGYRRHPEKGVPPAFDRIETDVQAAVDSSELLFITLPKTPETTNLFSKDILMSAHGKFLVNVGRGAVVDEEGLYLALKNGVLKGAALDTWYRYPAKGERACAPSGFPIHELPNVILSPHVGGSTHEAQAILIRQTCSNVSRFLRGDRCENEVDLEALY